MSGYPNKTPYDATKNRKKYLEELALRARLDDENLQANKLYKRTGAISTPPDTRTTTEKLADTYRLRIDIRSKLGQLMSGDDAQKVVNRLDQQELQFLAGRIDKYIADLKPKYSLGMPYQAFMAYFGDAIKAYNTLGDVDLSTATLLQNMITPDDLDRAIVKFEATSGTYEKRTFQALIAMYQNLMNGINQVNDLINNGLITDPSAIQRVQLVIQDAQTNVPTNVEFKQLQDDIDAYETGRVGSDGDRGEVLLEKIRRRLTDYKASLETLQNDTTNVEEQVIKTTPSIKPKKIYKQVKGFTYVDPNTIPDNISQNSLREYIRATRDLADETEEFKNEYSRLRLKITASKAEILQKLREPDVNNFMEKIWTKFETQKMTTPALQLGIGSQLQGVKLKPVKPTAPIADPTLLANLNQQQQSGSNNLTGSSGKSSGDVIEDDVKPYFVNSGLDYDVALIEAEKISGNRNIENEIRNYFSKNTINNIKLQEVLDWIESLIQGGSDDLETYIANIALPPNPPTPYLSSPLLTPPSTPPTPIKKIKLVKKVQNQFDPDDPANSASNNNTFSDQLIKTNGWSDVENNYNSMVSNDEIKLFKPKVSPFGQLVAYLMNPDGTVNKTGPKLSIDGLLIDINRQLEEEAKNGYYVEVPRAFDIATDWVVYKIKEFVNPTNSMPDKFIDYYKLELAKSTKSGGSLGSIMKRKSKMKGGSVRIDTSAGMTQEEKVPNYVPFGRYIINRSKLMDGIIMIKRPNGAFMGDLQSRRVSNNLKNVFEKIVGGNVPSYKDFSKLDNDEIEYLHYVAKKTNLADKLQVPTPNKDTEEKMISRYEVLRGQIIAGNDNKELIKEFKKLLLDMSDKKLLPRRQVSDILIDIEKMYG